MTSALPPVEKGRKPPPPRAAIYGLAELQPGDGRIFLSEKVRDAAKKWAKRKGMRFTVNKLRGAERGYRVHRIA